MNHPDSVDHLSNAPLVEVVASVIRRNGRVLVCKRPEGKRHAGLWEFPGGKVRPGESVAGAVRREILEELGLKVESVGETLFTARDPGSPYVILFVETAVSGEPEALEHEEVQWLRPEALSSLPLAPADRRFVAARLLSDLS